jgi:hypothetical protein
MTRISLPLTIALLAFCAIFASCGGASSTDILDDQEASSFDLAAPPVIEMLPEDGERAASFTPGLPCVIGAGFTWPNVLNYGWKGGNVTEGAFPNWVKLNTFAGKPPSWIIYNYKEAVVGRLQNIRIFGASSWMRVEMYNWRTGLWVNFGAYNLTAGPANIPVGIEYAPNGSTWVRLTEIVPGSVRIDNIRTAVF